jgi:hypothetical protein
MLGFKKPAGHRVDQAQFCQINVEGDGGPVYVYCSFSVILAIPRCS